MVSIVEVEIFGFFPYSNLPDFDQKWSKIGHFGPQMAQNQGFLELFLPNYVLLFPNFVFKVIYLDTLEH